MLDCILIACMLGQTNLHMHMSMAMDCLLLASWLGAFSVVVYTTMLLFGSSKCDFGSLSGTIVSHCVIPYSEA